MRIPAERYDAALEHFSSIGVPFTEHAFPGADNSRSVYVDDPDGNVVELWTWDVGRHLDAR
jgi:catechol-2,3-dioxygenase